MRTAVTATESVEAKDESPRAPSAAVALTLARAGDPAAVARLQGAIGNRAVTQLLARDPDSKAAPVGNEKDWSAAGPFGDKVRELLEDHLTTKDIGDVLDMLPGLVGEGAGAAVGAAGPKGIEAIGLDSDEAKKLAEGVSTWGEKAAVKWLQGPSGKKFLDKVRAKVGEYPKTAYWTLVSLTAGALGTGIGLWAAGLIDPPMLKKEFKIGKNWALRAGVDLGKPKEQWMQNALLGVGWQTTPLLHMDLDSTFKWSQDAKKNDVYTLGSQYKLSLLDSDDSKKTAFSLGLGGEYSIGSNIGKANLSLGGGPVNVNWGLVMGPSNTAMTFGGDAEVIKDALKLQIKGTMNSDPVTSADATKDKPKVSDTLGGGASGKAGGFDYSAAATWNFTDSQLDSLTFKLGYKNKDETLSWLADIAHSMNGKEQTDVGKAQLMAVIGDYVLRVDTQVKYSSGKDGTNWSGGGTASLGIPLWKSGVTLAPQLGFGYGSIDKNTGVTGAWWGQFGAGVSYKEIPNLSLIGAWNQPIGGGGAPGFFSFGIGGYLGKPEKKK